MKGYFKKIVSSLLAMLTMTSLVGCSNIAMSQSGNSSLSSSEDKEPVAATEVWSTYSTAKVPQNRNVDIYEKGKAEIYVSMMKNETEGTQLIISAGQDISSYELIEAELFDGKGNTISTEQIDIYHQKYMRIDDMYNINNTAYRGGDRLPDMILPMETAVEYKENTVKKGENQGITVEVTTNRDTVPGIYSGVFTLKLDGSTKKIPATVQVWDIEYEGRRSFQSCFLIYRTYLAQGEYGATDELMDAYMQKLLEYKINPYCIQSKDKGYDNEDNFAAYVERYFENENFNSIVIPAYLAAPFRHTDATADWAIRYIKKLVEICTPEKNYMEYAYMYISSYDEADVHSHLKDDAIQVFKEGGEYQLMLERALVECDAELDVLETLYGKEFRENVEQNILNVPAVFTNVNFVENYVDELSSVFCPQFNVLGSDIALQKYQAQAEEDTNGEFWTYTCCGPNNPYPTFHVDDFNLGTRVSGWMEKKYKVNGYLYWAVNLCEPSGEHDVEDFINPYDTPDRASDWLGDGYLLYPGKYYNSDSPFGSLRLVNYRDSMEDYDMLCVYENLLNEWATKYNTSINFDHFVNDLYASLFDKAIYYQDDALVYAARAELANRILALQNSDGLLVKSSISEDGQTTESEIYSTTATLKVNGETTLGVASGDGYKYKISTATGAGEKVLSVETAGKSYQYVLLQSGVANMQAYNKNTKSIVNATANGADVTIRSENKNNPAQTTAFRPYVEFEVSDFANATEIIFVIKNTTNSEIEANVQITGEDRVTVGGIYLRVGEEKEYRIQLSSVDKDVLSNATHLRIAFANTVDGVLQADRQFTIGNIRFVK
ncbi:MAG: DUF4091 domain-containing protein [Clostridiales bacterium]|nr:DUF4091 domain-containing protein [Clostridiales bacterium]